jgi:hypothetical protein
MAALVPLDLTQRESDFPCDLSRVQTGLGHRHHAGAPANDSVTGQGVAGAGRHQ